MTPSFIKKYYHSRRVQNPKQSMPGIIFKFSKILENSREISLLDLEAFSFHFHFSISISSHLYFTFISRSRYQVILFSLELLEKSEKHFFFTFSSRLSKTHSRRTLDSRHWRARQRALGPDKASEPLKHLTWVCLQCLFQPLGR